MAEEIKFAADKMLGRLARWLRIIGQDVAYGSHLAGHGLIRSALKESRLILTRDQKLLKKNPPDTLLIQSNHFREQLKQVVHTCGLDPLERAFTRCVECNKVLEAIPKEFVQDKVPPYVYSTQEKFSLCRRCERIYWPATHHNKMIEELKALGADSRGN
ncbi:MAG: Mut7-C RNAse domain-containing protein [Candidatus Binatia bacterium]